MINHSVPNQSKSTTQAAEIINVHKETVLKLIGTNQLRATNVGTTSIPRWRIATSDIAAFLESRCNMATPIICERTRSSGSVNTKKIVGRIK